MSSPPAPFVTVHSSRTVAGFILSRGPMGWEAFDADERLLGVYETQAEANE
jgi:hypothetical protein